MQVSYRIGCGISSVNEYLVVLQILFIKRGTTVRRTGGGMIMRTNIVMINLSNLELAVLSTRGVVDAVRKAGGG